MNASNSSLIASDPDGICEKILDVILEYALHKFGDTKQKLALGRPKFLETIAGFVVQGRCIQMCLPAFPFKSSNKIDKVLGTLPDKAEELALGRLNTMCAKVQAIHAPGAALTIISDGLVYNDLLSISDKDTWAYGEALRSMAIAHEFQHIRFARIRDLIKFPGSEVLNEITYVASATNFRRSLLNEFGKDDIDIDHEIATSEDTKMTYLGYRRFLESDLKHIFPLGSDRSANSYKRNVKFLAKEMIIRGYAFAGAVRAAFPEHLRLSIHQSTGEHKISISLLHTKTGFTTPWHCSVARLADGTWVSAQKADFELQDTMRMICENGRPSYFQEEEASEQHFVPTQAFGLGGAKMDGSHSLGSATELSLYANETLSQSTSEFDFATLKEQVVVANTHAVGPTTEQLINTFLRHDYPPLDPKSDSFEARSWLKNFEGLIEANRASNSKQIVGVSYRDLSVEAFWQPSDYQKTFWNQPIAIIDTIAQKLTASRNVKRSILKKCDGLIRHGEMLLVLGQPGSGCSTLLKSIAGELDQLRLGNTTYMNYQGVPGHVMHKEFRGEAAPCESIPGVNRDTYVTHVRDAYIAMFGLRHIADTKVGNAFLRGVSGGEVKRVSIAEAAVARSAIQCWDNSTRGLDSAAALDFVQTLRTSADIAGTTIAVTLYQAPQSVYNLFDKVSVLYEGRQIFFGPASEAKEYFIDLGFEPKPRQTTADFLTSVTSPAERRIRKDFVGRIPATPDDFFVVWQKSQQFKHLQDDIDKFNESNPIGGPSLEEFRNARRSLQEKSQRSRSPFTLSLPSQIDLCVWRGFQRLKRDMGILISSIIFNSILSIVIGSVFYGLPNDNAALYSRGVLLYFSIMLAAFASALEILVLYAQRPIVEKQARYAFCHPFAEAIASMLCDLPNKITTAIGSSLPLYFMTHLRRTPGHFFVFLVFTFACTLTMSMYFRCIAALSRTLAQAMAPASVFSLALVIYTGFAIPTRYMRPWLRWLNYLNPVGYAFESLMINEFHDRSIPCSEYVPHGEAYNDIQARERICATSGSTAGAEAIDGDVYLAVNFGYHASHLWRNLGIMLALMILGCSIYLLATEYVTEQKPKGETLLFQRGGIPRNRPQDEESVGNGNIETTSVLMAEPTCKGRVDVTFRPEQESVFHWDDVSFDIGTKGSSKRILQGVDGWIRPGTLTALMGVSGAGKTTLLDVLADRVSVGVVSGNMLVDGLPRGPDFRRQTGYAQQQDLHLASSTVREALNFSALLRQPRTVPNDEKIAYVEEVIAILDMEAYSDAVVGVPGEGLNVEQRKRLTIAVELVAKPAVLLFLDEPTSGLDSQTAWSICSLLRKLADNGQAILCTIHQPSAPLLGLFDRLLYLAMGGRTVYFGALGASCSAVIDYFQDKGARPCGGDENPAEWILDVTNTPRNIDGTAWADVWDTSEERQAVKAELARMKPSITSPITAIDADRPYAAAFGTQLGHLLRRGFSHYWRTPSYLWSKVALCVFSALFIGVSFWKMPNSIQGTQNQLFAVFLLLTIFTNFCQQMMPHAITRRELAEARELPSKVYSWQTFILSDIVVEVPWNSLMAVLVFACWYYPIGLQQNAIDAGQTGERAILMFLFILAFFNFAGTFTSMAVALMSTAESAGNITNLLFSLSLIFCGVLATPQALPGFWIFMYRISPLTYLVSGVLSVGLANTRIHCLDEELLHFSAPPSTNCSTYLAPYIQLEGGYLQEVPDSNPAQCVFCTGSQTNIFLKSVSAQYGDRWRNLGIVWAYVAFNLVATVIFYWLARVPKKSRSK
ncbi:unnamed protein product [Zymoseptoria tritici ST99CH_1A5]|uniref:ABC transporter domain-containing protein n=1 Tax=Zymoseptoria tritici ST99CH_1A5 TaxID=1276529 RepID=A0A1Y6LT45_ZYMTR|nr:unnamed protein product [Zymoseptoria tritici ST99CH_1A5]